MMKKTGHFYLAVLVFLLSVTTGYGATISTMPEFSLPSALDGKVVKSGDFSGKVLLITFFATWCSPCRDEVPTLIKLQNDYGAKGFSVVGMSVDQQGPRVVVKMIKKDGINYPVLMAEGKTARDFGGVVGIPTSFLVDKEGKIIKRYPGYVPRALLEKDIKDVL